MRRDALLLGLVLLLALGLRLAAWSAARNTPLDAWHAWDQSDMATYCEQARRIAAGDWLGRAPYHPYHLWQSAGGTPDDWLRWYGPHVFNQAPLYSYLLALASRLTDRWIDLVRLAQIGLSVAACALLAGVARRLADRRAGLLAALLAALYGPALLMDFQILRENGMLFGLALLLWLLVRRAVAATGPPSARPADAFASAIPLGLTLGILAMFHEAALPLAAATLLALLTLHRRAAASATARALAGLLCGAAIGFAPLLVRNVVVGAPPLSISTRPPLTFAAANMVSAPNDGLLFARPGPELRRILDAAGGSTLGVVRETARGYAGRPLEWPRRMLKRLGAWFVRVEVPDNVSFEFHRRHLPPLRWTLTFATLFPLGAAGLIGVFAARLRARRAAPPPAGAAHAAIGCVLLLLIATAAFTAAQGRYRLLLVPVFIPYAALTLSHAADWLAARRFGPLLAGALGCAALVAFQAWLTKPLASADRRSAYPITVANRYAARGADADAIDFYREGLALSPRDADARRLLAQALARLKRWPEALREYETLARVAPQTPGLAATLDYVRRQAEPAP
ncbi:MAG: bacterial transcriptional activator domain-containing protein [Phycisphaerae bacterium]